MGSEHRERGTQTEGRVDDGLEQRSRRGEGGEEGEMANGGLLVLVKNKGEGEKEEGEMVKRRNGDLGRKLNLSKSFSRLLSFRRVKK